MRQDVTRDEVARHNTPKDAWMIVGNTVYDVTKFAKLHPGGTKLLLEYAGKDVTQEFYELHRHSVLDKYLKNAVVGRLQDADPSKDFTGPEDGELSLSPYTEANQVREGWSCPYMNESHLAYRKALRKFLYSEVRSEAMQFESLEKVPSKDMHRLVASRGLYAAKIGPGEHMHGMTIFGVKGEDFDLFHEMITHLEWAKIGAPAYQDGLGTGLVIGLPPVLLFAQPEVKQKVQRECLSGEKAICLAITEPFAGSDVAGIRCRAEKSKDGKHYIVNGVKKWITNGVFADYFVTAVRTGPEGMGGISLLVIARDDTVETSNIKTSYGSSSGTAYVVFEDTYVPVENLLGQENKGFGVIMSNFNHERWFVVCSLLAANQCIIDETWKWISQRRAFGKALIEQPVVRQKMAHMIGKTEAIQNWLDNITFQMTKMNSMEQFMHLGGPISVLKMFTTRVSYEIADDVTQIFGGRALTKSGLGIYVERFQRSIKFGAILGGSEEIMADLGVKIGQRFLPKQSKL